MNNIKSKVKIKHVTKKKILFGSSKLQHVDAMHPA